jgi:3-oxoacyl-[acyl-carrier protein] reductase
MNEKQVMIITGTSRGIGRMLAEYYCNKGYIVFGGSREISDFTHPDYHNWIIDIRIEKFVLDLIRDVKDEFGRIDILINNAGIGTMNHSFFIPSTMAEKIFATNVIGTFLMSREAAKVMSKRKYGRIINFASFAVPFKLEGEAIYAASKAAVITLTEILAREYAPYNITVNAISPPAMRTDLTKGVPEEKMQKLLQRQAIHRYGYANDITNTIDFLINPMSEMITGQTIYMGGL